jgi:hypothetical protein
MEIKENADLVRRLLDVMEHDILPLTEKGVPRATRCLAAHFCASQTCRW